MFFGLNSGDPRESRRAWVLRDEQPDRDSSSDVSPPVHRQAQEDRRRTE